MAIFKSLKFDNEDSLDYGVYVTGESVYNAPERDVEMIAVPGRNGEYALDHGRFNNIEVTYPAGIGEMSQEAFAEKISAFRNALASRKGYYRLEDGYHPDEFRMGIYKSGLEASPVQYGRAGEFDLTFNCKPQRFLKSGEERTEFTSDGTITNPTLFESKPLLELYGYGTLNVNGSEIVLHNEPLGVLELLSDLNSSSSSAAFTLPAGLFNAGDEITLDGATYKAIFSTSAQIVSFTPGSSTLTNLSTTTDYNRRASDNTVEMYAELTDISFTAGTAKTCSYSSGFQYQVAQRPVELPYIYSVAFKYDGGRTITVIMSSGGGGQPVYGTLSTRDLTTGNLTVDSSVYSIGAPLYIDCEIGEAYNEEDGEITLINQNIEIPSDLPVLSPGENEIVMDSTYAKVNVIPRWWII